HASCLLPHASYASLGSAERRAGLEAAAGDRGDPALRKARIERVGGRAHLRDIEAGQLVLRLGAEDADRLQDAEEDEWSAERPDEADDRTDDLRHELATVAEEDALRRNASPARRAVREDAHCQHAPGAAGTVH